MNEPVQEGGTFLTLNCIDNWIDEPGDSTVRPIPPSRIEHARAERAKVYGTQVPIEKPADPDVRGN